MRINNIFTVYWKKILAVVLTVTILTMPAFTGIAVANQSGLPSDATENDMDFDAVLEYVESDMEEKAVINEDGTVSNYYSSAAEAGVSEKAFQEFEAMLVSVNKEVKAGNMEFGEGLFDIKIYEPNVMISGGAWCFTNQQVKQAVKLIAAGAGLSALASFLGVPGWVAGGFALLAAAAELCNWFDNGMCIFNVGSNWWCVPIP